MKLLPAPAKKQPFFLADEFHTMFSREDKEAFKKFHTEVNGYDYKEGICKHQK